MRDGRQPNGRAVGRYTPTQKTDVISHIGFTDYIRTRLPQDTGVHAEVWNTPVLPASASARAVAILNNMKSRGMGDYAQWAAELGLEDCGVYTDVGAQAACSARNTAKEDAYYSSPLYAANHGGYTAAQTATNYYYAQQLTPGAYQCVGSVCYDVTGKAITVTPPPNTDQYAGGQMSASQQAALMASLPKQQTAGAPQTTPPAAQNQTMTQTPNTPNNNAGSGGSSGSGLFGMSTTELLVLGGGAALLLITMMHHKS